MFTTFSLPLTFLDGCKAKSESTEFCITGIPFDLGTTNRSGTRDGLHAVRRASRMLADGANPEG